MNNEPREDGRRRRIGSNPSGGVPVREVRKAANISLRQLEDLTGISRATWSHIERGRLLPDPSQIAALSDALGVPYEEWRIRFSLERVQT